MITPTALDSLKYAVAQAESTIDWATDYIACADGMTDELEETISPAQESLHDLMSTLRSALAPHVQDRADWFIYSDGRPLQTEVTVGDCTYSHLWHPNPLHEVPAPRETQIPSGVQVPALRTATVSYELPSKIIVRVGDEVIAQAGRGDAEMVAAWRSQSQEVALVGQVGDLEEIEAATGEAHSLSLSPSVDQLRQVITQIEQDRDSQPERLREMRAQARQARAETLAVEPWGSVLTAAPTFTGDGDLEGMLAFPTITAKEMFGTRLAFDLSTCTDDKDVNEVLVTYFDAVGEPDHMMVVATAALSTMALHVLPALLEIAEHKASNYNVRVNLADSARNAWAKRIRDFDSEENSL